MTCGAKTRAGHPCRRKATGRGGRCSLHGGKSTGPRSIWGRERIASAQRERWLCWKANNSRVLPELSRKQELRLLKRFSAWMAGAQTRPLDRRYLPRLARRAQREAENRFAIALIEANPPRRQQHYYIPDRRERSRRRWRGESA